MDDCLAGMRRSKKFGAGSRKGTAAAVHAAPLPPCHERLLHETRINHVRSTIKWMWKNVWIQHQSRSWNSFSISIAIIDGQQQRVKQVAWKILQSYEPDNAHAFHGTREAYLKDSSHTHYHVTNHFLMVKITIIAKDGNHTRAFLVVGNYYFLNIKKDSK